MREAGAHVRHHHLQSVRSELTDDVVLAAVARAAFYKNLGLANFMVQQQRLAREFWDIKAGKAFLKDGIKFADMLAKARRGCITKDLAALHTESGGSSG
eukprot:2689020-Karenia_brevis.AAC.1